MRACEYNSLEMIKLLVENGADVNAKMGSGWRALFVTVKKNNPAAFDYLMKKGANLDGKGKHRSQE